MQIKKVYEGKMQTGSDRQVVTVNGAPLLYRLDIVDYSPTGLTWGFNGSGPNQLAIALLADAFTDDFAKRYAPVILEWIMQLPRLQPWCVTDVRIMNLLGEYVPDDQAANLSRELKEFYD